MTDPWAKECTCVTHDEPHWLHMDRFSRTQSLGHLEQGNIRAFVLLEEARLHEKQRIMKQLQVECVPAHLCATDLDERERHAWLVAFQRNPREMLNLLRYLMPSVASEWEQYLVTPAPILVLQQAQLFSVYTASEQAER